MTDTEANAAMLEAEAADAADDAEFARGFGGEPAAAKQPEKPADAPAESTDAKPGTETPAAPPAPAGGEEPPPAPPAEEAPKYVQVTEKEWAEVRAAAAKTASYDGQLSKAFGTIGNLQKIVTTLQASTQAGRKVEIPKDAFAAMEQDFPELAEQTRAALEKALGGVVGTAQPEFDEAKLKAMLATSYTEREIETMDDEYPDWRAIVGATAPGETPPADNPFRMWLATKDDAYQAKVNNATSAAVITRAIRSFEADAKAKAPPPTPQPPPKPAAPPPPPKPAPAPRDTSRGDRIRDAIQPRGDGAGRPPPGKTDDDEFLAGFNSR